MGVQEKESRSREERINALTDQEALAIVDLIAGEQATMETPAGETEQEAALGAAFAAVGQPLDLSLAAEADTAAAGRAARDLLRIMALVPELQDSLDAWLNEPPRQEALAIPLVLAVPVVFAGCIALLHVVGHARFRRDPSGKWEFDYDPTTPAPMDDTLRDAVKTMADLIRPLIPGSGSA